MKILLIDSHEFLTNDNKSDGIFTFDQAKFLSKNDYKVDILSPGIYPARDILKKKIYKNYERLNGIKIYRKYKKNIIPFRIRFLNPLIVEKISSISLDLFEDYLKYNRKPDLLHAHKIRYSAYAAYAIFLKYNIPYVITEHNSDIIQNKFPNSLKDLTRKIIKQSKNFNTVSNTNSKILSKYFNIKKVEVINNLIPEIFTKKYKRNKSKKKYSFISISRFDENKNNKIVINSFIKNFNNLNSSLEICGGGNLINEYRTYIKKKGFENKIKLYGNLSRSEILKKYLKADCFIIASHKETFCLSLFEALMFNIYCITSRHSGYYELKKININLPSFDSRDENNLSRLMLHAYYTKKKFNYKKIILKKFGYNIFLKRIKKIYIS